MHEDLKLAIKICEELKNEIRDGIQRLYIDYNDVFRTIVKRFFSKNISSHLDVNDILTDFWIKLIEDPSIICSYKASASLQSYLIRVLINLCIDKLRVFHRNHEPCSLEDVNPSVDWEDSEEIREFRWMLLKFSEKHPEDADLIWLRAIGLTYQEILGVMDEPFSSRALNKIRKKTSRAKERFKKFWKENS